MITNRTEMLATEPQPAVTPGASRDELQYERWNHWPVNWTAVWVGALAAIAAGLIIGLIGVAVGAHLFDPGQRWVDLKKMSIWALIFSVCGAFFSFAIGGWVTGKVAGVLRSEPAMLHGAICWLVAVPFMAALIGLGAGSLFGGWYAGLGGTPSWAAPAAMPFDRPEPLGPNASAEERRTYNAALEQYRAQVEQWKADTPKVTRNTALGTVTALLLSLVGAVIGGWMACGEPMNFHHFRTRHPARANT
jgi:uncharacterized membrane protein YeaQ/YmgE (transglycosylase-associated protein family)